MKKLVSVLLAAIMSLSLAVSSLAVTNESAQPDDLETLTSLAEQYLDESKLEMGVTCSSMGFDPNEFCNASLGLPYVTYRFDSQGAVLSDDIYSFPMIYGNEIIGTICICYNEESECYNYSLGADCAEELNGLRNSGLDTSNGLLIGNIGGKRFATDGVNAQLLLDMRLEVSEPVSMEQIQEICDELFQNPDVEYLLYLPSDEDSSQPPFATFNETRAFTNPLPVPHVKQTGVCGVAAWAAVLNFRFDIQTVALRLPWRIVGI